MQRAVLIRRLIWLSLAGLLCAGPAMAAGCPIPIAGAPVPPEAQPGEPVDPVWRGYDAKLDQVIAGTDLAGIKLLFLGDSITAGWAPPIFQQFYGTRAALNLGIRGDNTQGLLWRLGRLPLGTTLKPKLAVMLIGTNDLWPGANAQQVGTGIAAVLHTLRSRSPGTHVLLIGLLPRGQSPADPLRDLVRKVNATITPCADGRMVVLAEPGSMLLDGGGALSNQIAFDYLHPTWLGYAILSAGLEPYIRHVLADR